MIKRNKFWKEKNQGIYNKVGKCTCKQIILSTIIVTHKSPVENVMMILAIFSNMSSWKVICTVLKIAEMTGLAMLENTLI